MVAFWSLAKKMSAVQEKYDNHLVPDPIYMMDTAKLSKQTLVVSG